MRHMVMGKQALLQAMQQTSQPHVVTPTNGMAGLLKRAGLR